MKFLLPVIALLFAVACVFIKVEVEKKFSSYISASWVHLCLDIIFTLGLVSGILVGFWIDLILGR